MYATAVTVARSLGLVGIVFCAVTAASYQNKRVSPSSEPASSSGLTFHYPPYAVGPCAEGEYVVFVAWETQKPFLTPEGIRILGGARPKSDEDAAL